MNVLRLFAFLFVFVLLVLLVLLWIAGVLQFAVRDIVDRLGRRFWRRRRD